MRPGPRRRGLACASPCEPSPGSVGCQLEFERVRQANPDPAATVPLSWGRVPTLVSVIAPCERARQQWGMAPTLVSVIAPCERAPSTWRNMSRRHRKLTLIRRPGSFPSPDDPELPVPSIRQTTTGRTWPSMVVQLRGASYPKIALEWRSGGSDRARHCWPRWAQGSILWHRTASWKPRRSASEPASRRRQIGV